MSLTDKQLAYAKKYRDNNREKCAAAVKAWAAKSDENRERLRAASRAWKKRNAEKIKADRAAYFQREKMRELENHRKWVAEHPEQWAALQKADRARNGKVRRERRKPKRNEHARKRRREDARYAVEMRLRGLIGKAINRYGHTKAARTFELTGCSLDDLMRHLERQFVPGMTWDNRGEWHIDHIRPCASFDLRDGDQQRQCFHWTNLQPLWRHDNLKKCAAVYLLDRAEAHP